jgi:hypothetical protein
MRGADPFCHFPLYHTHHLGDLLPVIQDPEKDLAGDIIREIPDDGNWRGKFIQQPGIEEIPQVDLIRLSGIIQLKVFPCLLIDLQQVEARMGFEKELAQHPFTRTEFQDGFPPVRLQAAYDLPGDILIPEEMLSERFFRPYLHCSDFP